MNGFAKKNPVNSDSVMPARCLLGCLTLHYASAVALVPGGARAWALETSRALKRASELDPRVYPPSRVLGGGLRIGRDVEIQPSGRRGDGVFALRTLPPGAFIGWYTGEVSTNVDYVKRRAAGLTTGDYAISLDGAWTIDAEDPATSSWLRYINHSSRRTNAASYSAQLRGERGGGGRGATFFETKKVVRAGEELLVDYGEDYWLYRYPAGPLDPRWWAVELS